MESYFFNISTPVRLLLFRRIANAIDDTEIMAAVSKIRLYESGDGNEAEMLSSLILQIPGLLAYIIYLPPLADNTNKLRILTCND